MNAVSPEKRRGRPVDDSLPARRAEEILDAAARRFADAGYADTDIDSVAALLHVGKGTIYRYFASKQELFLAAVDRGMQRLQCEVEQSVAGVTDGIERIERAIHAFLAYFDAHSELVELFVQERSQFKNRRKPAYFAHREAHVGPWRDMYRQLVDAGRVRDLGDDDDLDVVNDLLFGTILANCFTGRRAPFEAQAEQIIDLVFSGLLTDAERKRRRKRADRRE